MNTTPDSSMHGKLAGVRVWLSGAVPDGAEDNGESIKAFVGGLAAAVFRANGYLLHGSHPSLVDILLAQTQHYREATDGRDEGRLTLAVSQHYTQDPQFNIDLDAWQAIAQVHVEPEIDGDLASSLARMRFWMAERCDAVVVVGGRWWDVAEHLAGIPRELRLAVERGLPCFFVGGLGGAAEGYLRERPEVLRMLKNGLDEETNRRIATEADPAKLVNLVIEQLARLPLVRGRAVEGSTFRILALDGGGILGAFTAAVLATWEEITGLSVVDHFDLIAGTSTGGILALGLAAGRTAKEMLDFYTSYGPTIFPTTSHWERVLHSVQQIVKPKYDASKLREAVRAVYRLGNNGDRDPVMGDARCRLLIPVMQVESGKPTVFLTPHAGTAEVGWSPSMVDVALATAAAPTYFTAGSVETSIAEGTYVDGGVWANCPVLAAVAEAVGNLRIPLERIDVLSIGTSYAPFDLEALRNGGGADWLNDLNIVKLFMESQALGTEVSSKLLLSAPRFMRINPPVAPGRFALDKVNSIESLAVLGETAAKEAMEEVRARFLNGVHAQLWSKNNRQR